MTDDRTYSIADAARYLEVSTQTVYAWLREGRLVEARDAAGKRRVTAASVEARPQKRSPYERRG